MKDKNKKYHRIPNRPSRVRKQAALVLSLLVIIGTVYGLSMPAITMSVQSCGLSEHWHGEGCYGEDGTLICSLPEHGHSEACYTTIEETPVQEAPLEPVTEGGSLAQTSLQTESELDSGEVEMIAAEPEVLAAEDTSPLILEERTNDGVLVHVEAEHDAFSVPVSLRVTPVRDETLLDLAKEEDGRENVGVQAVDITFLDSAGTQVEPVKPIQVTMRAALVAEAEEVTVVHIDDRRNTALVRQLLVEEQREDEVVFASDAFSVYALVYTVDFYFGDYEYHLEGGEALWLSELLTLLPIEKNIDGDLLTTADLVSVTFSDEALLSVTAQNGDWLLESLQPFETEETLTFGLRDGRTLDIRVTDALPEGELDFRDMINNVTIKKRGPNWNEWVDADLDHLNVGDELQFRVNYVIDGQGLRGSTTIGYELPDAVNLTSSTTGTLYNSQSQPIGNYRIENDQIHITFLPGVVQENMEYGEAISGFITFTGRVDASEADGNNDVFVAFSDEVKIKFHYDAPPDVVGDVTVQKSQSVNSETGVITYTIEVTSEEGTYGSVNLRDTFSNIRRSDGDQISVTPTDVLQSCTPDENGFSMVLSPMSPGGRYTVTYQASVKEDASVYNDGQGNAKVNTSNAVSAESETEDGVPLRSNSSVSYDVVYRMLGKTSADTESGDKIRWTVTVNEAGRDISGWTLSDVFNSNSFSGPMSVSPPVEGRTEVSLPYTFPQGSNQTYTLTYETEKEKSPYNNQAINRVSLTPPNPQDQTITKEQWHYIGGDTFVPLRKAADLQQGQEVPRNSQGKLELPWVLVVDTTEGSLPAGWTLYDELQNKNWYTYDQLQDFLSNFSPLNYTLQVWLYKDNGETGEERSELTPGLKYKAVKLTFREALAYGQRIEIHYTSTADEPESSREFFNIAEVNNGFRQQASTKVTVANPSIKKYDALTPFQSGSTTHSIDEAENPAWQIALTIPAGYNKGTMYVDELLDVLPEGVQLGSLTYEENAQTYPIGTTGTDVVTYEVRQSGRNIRITIPSSVANNPTDTDRVLIITLSIELTEGVTWKSNGQGVERVELQNKLQLLNQNHVRIDEASQKQTITRREKQPLIKKTAPNEPPDSIIPYSIDINPEGADLLPGADTVILEDVMEYRPYNNLNWRASLVAGSVHVYRRNEDGSQGTELTAQEYSYVYEESQYGGDQWNSPTYQRLLTLTLPDSTPLIVRYNYVFKGNDSWADISNRATLKGITESPGTTTKSIHLHIQDASAGADVGGVTIYKVDSVNHALLLPGAEYELWYYDSAAGHYKLKANGAGGSTWVTDARGRIPVSIAFNTAYQLIETKAPPGYQLDSTPYEFLVYSADTVANPEHKPPNFQGEIHYGGEPIYRPNEKLPLQTTTLTLVKEWRDSAGAAKQHTSGEIQVQVQRRRAGEGDWTDYLAPVTLTYDSAGSWQCTIEDLPVQAEDGTAYEYRVQEITIPGYKVSYENNAGISSGTITIFNTEENTYVLPETGGRGTKPYVISGGGLIILALALFRYEHHVNRRRRPRRH